MACSCQGGTTGNYQVVLADSTVPAKVGDVTNDFATAHAAQTALNTSGQGGYVRVVRQAATV